MTVTFGLRGAFVPFIAVVLCGLLVPVPADAGELFRYRLPTANGRKSNNCDYSLRVAIGQGLVCGPQLRLKCRHSILKMDIMLIIVAIGFECDGARPATRQREDAMERCHP